MSCNCADKDRESHNPQLYCDLKIDVVGSAKISAEDRSEACVLLVSEFEIRQSCALDEEMSQRGESCDPDVEPAGSARVECVFEAGQEERGQQPNQRGRYPDEYQHPSFQLQPPGINRGHGKQSQHG